MPGRKLNKQGLKVLKQQLREVFALWDLEIKDNGQGSWLSVDLGTNTLRLQVGPYKWDPKREYYHEPRERQDNASGPGN